MVVYDAGDLRARCDRILELMEQDRAGISRSLSGDLEEEYRKYLDKEMQLLREIRKNLMYITG